MFLSNDLHQELLPSKALQVSAPQNHRHAGHDLEKIEYHFKPIPMDGNMNQQDSN